MKRLLIALLPLTGFTGCLFDLTNLGPGNPAKPDFAGMVRMTDLQGAMLEGYIDAFFRKPDDENEGALSRTLRSQNWDGSPQCGITQMTYLKEDSSESSAKETKFLAMGKLSYRNYLQGSDAYVPVQADKTNYFYKEIPPRIASGIYVFEARATDGSLLFTEQLSMPEPLNEALANGMQYSVGLFAKRNEAIELQWQSPTTAPERNLIQTQLWFDLEKSSKEVERHTLRCLAMESQLLKNEKGGKIYWEIAAQYVNQLPLSTKGVFLFSRIHYRGTRAFDVGLYGYRSLITRARLDPAD